MSFKFMLFKFFFFPILIKFWDFLILEKKLLHPQYLAFTHRVESHSLFIITPNYYVGHK